MSDTYSRLAPGGHTELSYNGVSFGCDVRTEEFAVRPRLDASRRTVVANDWALTFRCLLAGTPDDE